MAARKLKPGLLAGWCKQIKSLYGQSGKHLQVAADSVKAVLLYQQQHIEFIQYAMVEELLQQIP